MTTSIWSVAMYEEGDTHLCMANIGVWIWTQIGMQEGRQSELIVHGVGYLYRICDCI